MVRELEDILQDVNALFVRAEAKPPFTIDLLDKGAAIKVEYSSAPGGQDKEIQSETADQRLLRDPNVLIGGIRDSQGRNIIEPWADSNSLFAGFAGNFKLLTEGPVLLYEILSLFVEPEPEPEPIPEYVEPPVPPVKLKNVPKKKVSEED